jgi:hypothetical protein
MVGARNYSGTSRVRTTRCKSRNVFRGLLALWSPQRVYIYRLEKNLEPSTKLCPPWACHCWKCHQQNVGEILHGKKKLEREKKIRERTGRNVVL